MRAAILRHSNHPFQIEEIQLELPRSHEVQVQIVGVGICHTDVKMAQGYRPIPLPVVLGHEGAGMVTAVGANVTKVKPGDPVVISFTSCGFCDSCQSGHPAFCDDGDALCFGCARPEDGSSPISKEGESINGYFFGQSSFATHVITPERNVVKAPEGVSIEMLGPLGCGIQTGAGAILNVLNVQPGTSLAVFGTGSVGLSAIMAGVIAGATTIVAVDLNQERLDLALDLGATHALNPLTTDGMVASIKSICSEKGAHYTLDTTNVPSVIRQAFESLRPRGTCGHVGGVGQEITISGTQLLFGRSLVGVVQGDSLPDVFIPRLIDLYRAGRFPFDRLVTYYTFEEINKAVEDMEAGKTIKPVLKMSETKD
ncbi:MAG: NAD(P)-dependent alcohol dehydrogenase [Chloroflexota bacterium]